MPRRAYLRGGVSGRGLEVGIDARGGVYGVLAVQGVLEDAAAAVGAEHDAGGLVLQRHAVVVAEEGDGGHPVGARAVEAQGGRARLSFTPASFSYRS